MDYVTRQFINLSKKFRKELPKITALLRKDIKQQTEAIREARSTYKQSRDTTPVLRAELKVPQTIEVQTSPKDEKTGREWYKLIVGTLTLLGVLAYAAVTIRMWHEMISARHQTQHAVDAANRAAAAADIANSNFVESNRPWLGAVQGPTSDLTINTNLSDSEGRFTRFEYIWRFKNAGRRPAHLTRIRTVGHWYPKECSSNPDYRPTMKGIEGFPHKWDESSRALVIPDTEIYSRFGGPIPSDTWQMIDTINNPKLTFCIYALIEYEDVANPTITHRTKECRQFVPAVRSVGQCVNTFNDAD